MFCCHRERSACLTVDGVSILQNIVSFLHSEKCFAKECGRKHEDAPDVQFHAAKTDSECSDNEPDMGENAVESVEQEATADCSTSKKKGRNDLLL